MARLVAVNSGIAALFLLTAGAANSQSTAASENAATANTAISGPLIGAGSAGFTGTGGRGEISPDLRPRGSRERGLFSRRDDGADAIGARFEAYIDRAIAARGLIATPLETSVTQLTPASAEKLFWWNDQARAIASGPATVTPLPLSDLLSRATASAFQIGVFAELPAIRQTAVDEARGRFVPEAFAEARRGHRDETTTALFQTGGNPRLKESDSVLEFGVRSRLRSGGQVTLSERFSNLQSNIITYRPGIQSRSRTTLGLVQPLLREAGAGYNNSFEKIAGLETEAAALEFRRQVESHLLEVTRTYWSLYLARANLVQQTRAADLVGDLVRRIQGRSSVDGMALQLNRARATEAERLAGLVRSRNAVRNAEARLRALINDPALNAAGAGEIAPADLPSGMYTAMDLKPAVATAIKERPEVQVALLNYRSALLREGIAANENLPQLDLVLEGSLNGGNGGYAWGSSFTNAYDQAGSYTAGLRFSVPLGADERRARYARRRIESFQQALQARQTVETVVLELEVSTNEYVSAFNDLLRRSEALRLADTDRGVLGTRYQSGLSVGGGGGPSDGILYLDQLLVSQERVANTELDVAEAQATLQVATANLSRARGTLLADMGLAIVRDRGDEGTIDRGLPRFRIVKASTLAASK
jgi:outer membrane protein TolC